MRQACIVVPPYLALIVIVASASGRTASKKRALRQAAPAVSALVLVRLVMMEGDGTSFSATWLRKNKQLGRLD